MSSTRVLAIAAAITCAVFVSATPVAAQPTKPDDKQADKVEGRLVQGRTKDDKEEPKQKPFDKAREGRQGHRRPLHALPDRGQDVPRAEARAVRQAVHAFADVRVGTWRARFLRGADVRRDADRLPPRGQAGAARRPERAVHGGRRQPDQPHDRAVVQRFDHRHGGDRELAASGAQERADRSRRAAPDRSAVARLWLESTFRIPYRLDAKQSSFGVVEGLRPERRDRGPHALRDRAAAGAAAARGRAAAADAAAAAQRARPAQPAVDDPLQPLRDAGARLPPAAGRRPRRTLLQPGRRLHDGSRA